MRLLFVGIFMVSFILSACGPGEESATEIDLLNSLPHQEYTSVFWYSPADYANSRLVNKIKTTQPILVPLISQRLGFNPDKITNRFGLASKDCTYIAVFQNTEETLALMATPLTTAKIQKAMNRQLGYEFSKREHEGYTIYEDSQVGRGFIHSQGWILVASSETLMGAVDTWLAETGGFDHPLLQEVAAMETSIGFHSKPLAEVDSANFAYQVSRLTDDQETVDRLTSAATTVHTYSGALNLDEAVTGTVAIHFGSSGDAAAFASFLVDNGDAIRQRMAGEAVEAVEQIGVSIFDFTEADVVTMLESFAFTSKGEQLQVEVSLPWTRLAPILEMNQAQ